jgi:outer membrane lipoprotein-sorting protein
VVAVVLTAGVAGQALTADADPSLPPRTAAELLVDLQTSAVTGLSGTVVQRADLGLPELPVSLGGQGSSDFTALVSGTHTLRVWYAGEERQRIALLGSLGESDLVRNGRDVWTWSSNSNEATHLQLPADTPEQPLPTDLPTTPQDAADLALSAIEPSTAVSTDGTAVVAGRPAYELVLRPKDGQSLVGQVRIAIDAEQNVPLRVRVYAADATDPAVEIGFTQVSFEMPGDEHFEFTPPLDSTVTELSPSDAPAEAPAESLERPRMVGSGWTAVLITDAPDVTDSTAEPSEFEAILGSLPSVSGSWGSGRLLESALFSVLVTNDGRLLLGAVNPERLFEAASP